MPRNRSSNCTSLLLRHFSTVAALMSVLLLLACSSAPTQAETLKKRYTFAYDRATRRASSAVAANQARKRLLRDFLSAKFSPEIINNLAEDIDVALDPPDQFLTTFNIVSEKVNDTETQVTLTVEGDFDLAEVVSALVQNKVLSFGKQPPKVMVLPSSRFADPKAAKTLRAMIYEKIRQAGLRPVAFESASDSISFRIQDKITPTSLERQALIRQATQYGADYLIYIDAEVEAKPFSQGGYIADANFIHTILRPNGGLILGESIVSERGSGSSAMLAFDRALDSVAPVIAKVAIGQLYESIYSDSDVIYSTPQLKEEKTVVVNFANAALVQMVIDRLEKSGATASLGTGMSGVSSRLKIETSMDDVDLYEWFNQQTFSVGGKTFKTPVISYSENVIEVEAVAELAKPKQEPLAKAPPRKPRPRPKTQPDSAVDAVAKVILKLRPPKFN